MFTKQFDFLALLQLLLDLTEVSDYTQKLDETSGIGLFVASLSVIQFWLVREKGQTEQLLFLLEKFQVKGCHLSYILKEPKALFKLTSI